MSKIRKRFIFRGYVQGVGFRYRASNSANHLGLTGWVRNEYDGSVMMEVQGEEALINELLVILNNSSWIDISDMEEKTLPIKDEERSFIITD